MNTKNKQTGFILLHGATMGEWIWQKLIPLLKYPATAINNRVGLEKMKTILKVKVADCVQYLASEIENTGYQKVILVGHSGSGFLLPLVAEKIQDRVKHLVFICANIPPQGKRAVDIFPLFLKWMNILSIKLMSWGFKPSIKKLEKMIRNYFCNCCDEATIQLVLKHPQSVEPPCLATEKIYRPELPNILKTFIKLLQDRTASIELQEKLIRNLGNTGIAEINTDHMVMLSKPEELAKILNEI